MPKRTPVPQELVGLGRDLALLGASSSTRGQAVPCPLWSPTPVLDGEFQHPSKFLFLLAPNLVTDVHRGWLNGEDRR